MGLCSRYGCAKKSVAHVRSPSTTSPSLGETRDRRGAGAARPQPLADICLDHIAEWFPEWEEERVVAWLARQNLAAEREICRVEALRLDRSKQPVLGVNRNALPIPRTPLFRMES
jgi:hypothetical protein